MDLKVLKRSRQYMRSDVTKTFNSVQINVSSYSEGDVRTNLMRLKSLHTDIKGLDSQILTGIYAGDDEDLSQKEYDTCVDYDKKLITCIAMLESRLLDFQSLDTTQSNPDLPRNQLKLPQLPLPEYSHREGEDLNKFFSNFEHVINKYSLSSYEKFIFLQKQLRNEPLTLVKSLEIGSQDYESAKELLVRAFASSLTQKYSTIKELSELTLPVGGDPYEYIGKMRTITESFRNLKIDTDAILQYFFWNGMNDCLQHQFMHITNKNKPSLKDINDHIFDATERYQMILSKNKIKGKRSNPYDKDNSMSESSSFAVNVNYQKDQNDKGKRKPYCPLCSGKGENVSSHFIWTCKSYPTPTSKIDRLSVLKGCFKCGNLSHSTDHCNFRFRKKCFHCSKYHFSFLCQAVDSKTSERVSPQSKVSQGAKGKASSGAQEEVSSGTILLGCTQKEVSLGTALLGGTTFSTFGQDAIIPTFSMNCVNRKLRGMRDTGCQATFITEKTARELGLSVLQDNFSLTIHGFNQSDKINTSIVEFPIFDVNKISAICVPNIRTRLHLPGLSTVVRSFTSKGYQLADEFLLDSRDEIADLDFILGNQDAQFLLQKEIKFGKPPYSVYAETDKGILLGGSIERMLENVAYLPDRRDESVLDFGENFNIQSNSVDFPSQVSGFDDYEIEESFLNEAIKEALKDPHSILNYDEVQPEENNEVNDKLINYVLHNTHRGEDGRLTMPLLWNGKVCNRLGRNFYLSKCVLESNLRKLQKNPEHLKMYDEVFQDQLNKGIIERIEDLPEFIKENPCCSFLPHMGVFRPDRESTKCRIVYLSNLCENKPNSKVISHNQAMLSGPNLNKKISTSLIQLRFDRFLMCFDLKKAFLSIALNLVDQNRLLFLWCKDVASGDFSIVGYKSLRLAFGLRCSPTILMLAMYKLLVIDTENDPHELKDLKSLIYHLMYMDNGSVTGNDPEFLKWAYEQLSCIFEPYQFKLQQFCTNSLPLQEHIDTDSSDQTPVEVKLFGLIWNRESDQISVKSLKLDGAADTKRCVLSSIAANYDIFQIQGPLLNRARLFLHKLQCNSKLSWDEKLNSDDLHEWKNISKQVNAASVTHIDRFVGTRNSEYKLIAFTDSNKSLYGTVIFIKDLGTGKVNFLLSKNRVINKQLETKTIPSLELQALTFGIEVLIETYKEIVGETCVNPINVKKLEVYSDSMVCLNWINSYVHKLDKMQRKSTFVLNRLERIYNLCEVHPVTFKFVSGFQNPADCVTRPLSYKQLQASNFHSGPSFLKGDELDEDGDLCFTVPIQSGQSLNLDSLNVSVAQQPLLEANPLINLEAYSSFQKLIRVYRNVLRFIRNTKLSLQAKDPTRYQSMESYPDNLYELACRKILLADQRSHFAEIFNFFSQPNKTLKEIPNLVSQLNIFMDKNGFLRMASKFDRWKDQAKYRFPLLLAKDSKLVDLIISDIHIRFAHSGCYSVLTELRKQFYVPKQFSVVKKVLKKCTVCKRLNERTVKLNQSSYRQFRVEPPNIPFRYVFLDHFGPYFVKKDNKKVKVWVLCITCLWSRAINLKVCYDLTVKEFLRTFQLHIFNYGIPEFILSDLGSQLVSGANIITDLLKDVDTQLYLEERKIKKVRFEHYFKGCSALGGLVESCVKLTKRLIYGTIKNAVLDVVDFNFIISQAKHLANKRPIAFKEYLRGGVDSVCEEMPTPITPELLTKGYDIVSIDIIPSMPLDEDPEWKPDSDCLAHIKTSFDKLTKARERLVEVYHSEFLTQLVGQATNSKSRYTPVTHKKLHKGDIVLLKEKHTKAVNYPMGIILETVTNHMGEVTGAIVRKGCNKEKVKRHVSSLIPLVSNKEFTEESLDAIDVVTSERKVVRTRKAARDGREKIKKLVGDGRV